MSKAVVLTGVGRDRVGIVADLTQALFDLGCNLLDSSMTLVRGEFALILMAELPENVTIDKLEKKIDSMENMLGMKVHARQVELEDLEETGEVNAFIVSVYGADKPGIVARVSRALSDANINITDVQTKSTGSAGHKIFVMVLEVTAAPKVLLGAVERTLKNIGKELNVDIAVQALDVVEL